MCLFCREDAEVEYLKVAQDLEMFGINYFEIKVTDSPPFGGVHFNFHL